MDEQAINRKITQLTGLAEGVLMLIERFNPETVTILDKDYYRTELSSIFGKLTEFQTQVNTLKESLNTTEFHKAASTKVTTIYTNLKAKVIANETEVKRQMVKLVTESDSSRSDRSVEIEQEKLKFKVSNAKIKFDSLKERCS